MHWIISYIWVSYNQIVIIAGISELLEGETSNSEELHLKSSQETISRMSFSNSPRVVEVNTL